MKYVPKNHPVLECNVVSKFQNNWSITFGHCWLYTNENIIFFITLPTFYIYTGHIPDGGPVHF